MCPKLEFTRYAWLSVTLAYNCDLIYEYIISFMKLTLAQDCDIMK